MKYIIQSFYQIFSRHQKKRLCIFTVYDGDGSIQYRFASNNKLKMSSQYISQSMYLTEDSLKRNIAFGLNDDEIDEKKVMTVLKMACLEDFLSDLPDGIETRVGEFGTKLSGGQKQRVCIARALYFDPEILILDEATSALDYETEKEIMENISCLKGKLTMMIIAHRLQTIKECDAVYMVRKGRIERQQ